MNLSDRSPFEPTIARLTGLLVRFRWASLTVVALVTLAAASQLPRLQIDNSNEAFFVEGDPTQARLDAFRETFGNDDFVFILVDVEDAFAPATLGRLAAFAERLELEVPHLTELTWIGNAEWIEGVPGGIVIDELVPDIDLPAEALDALGAKAAGDPLYRDRLVSADRGTAGILLEFENYPEIGIDPRKDGPPVIAAIVADFDDLDTHVVGGPIADYVMDTRTAVEAPRWALVALVGMCLLLALTTRSVRGVLVPAATVMLSVVWTMGLVAVVGFKLNLLGILVPTLLLCVGIGDSMHVVAELSQVRREGYGLRASLARTLDLVTWPITLTTITTAAGFLAFLATDLAPLRELGVQAAVGVVIALVMTYLFAVPVLSFGGDAPRRGAKAAGPDIFDRLLAATVGLVARRPTTVGVAFLIVAVAVGFGITRLEIETNTVNAMAEDHPLRLAFDYVDDEMGGSMAIELVVDSGRADGIKGLELLAKVDRLQRFLEDHPLVTQTSSVVDQLKQMHRAVHENAPDAYRLPTSDGQIAEYLLLYESGGGSQLDQYVAFNYDQLRIQARTKSIAFGEVRELQAVLEAFVREEFDDGGTDSDGTEIYATGTLPMFQHIGDLIATGQARSFTFAFCAIAVILVVSLRSVALGLIAMIPNVLPVIVALGAMGWAGAEFNMIMLVLAPLVLGVAVDDTVHFFVRFRRYFDRTGSYMGAYRETLRTVGRPLLFTTLVLLAGFSGFLMSVFDGPRDFTIASVTAFTTALLAEFLLAPVLLLWFKPLGKPHQAGAVSATTATEGSA